MKAYLFDNNPATDGKHGELGSTHAGTITVDYEYQVEEWVKKIEEDEPDIVRIECPDLIRQWFREDGLFVEHKVWTAHIGSWESGLSVDIFNVFSLEEAKKKAQEIIKSSDFTYCDLTADPYVVEIFNGEGKSVFLEQNKE